MSLMNDGVKRIAFGYTRVSTEEQTYGASLENQRLAIQKYANQKQHRNNWLVHRCRHISQNCPPSRAPENARSYR